MIAVRHIEVPELSLRPWSVHGLLVQLHIRAFCAKFRFRFVREVLALADSDDLQAPQIVAYREFVG